MRLILLLTVIMAAGVAAGVLTGKAVAGGSQAAESTALQGVRETTLPSEGPLQVTQKSSSGEAPLQVRQESSSPQPLQGSREATFPNKALSPVSGTSFFTEAPAQVREVEFSGETLTDVSVRSMTAPISSLRESSLGISPLITATSTSFQAVQASREVPSAVTVLLVPLGDVNLDGVVGLDYLLLVGRALGTVPPHLSILLLDMNGDGVVDVLDMAIVASHIGDQLP